MKLTVVWDLDPVCVSQVTNLISGLHVVAWNVDKKAMRRF